MFNRQIVGRANAQIAAGCALTLRVTPRLLFCLRLRCPKTCSPQLTRFHGDSVGSFALSKKA